MALGLDTCPDEIIECVAKLLDLDDIRNLRLSSKSLAVKSSQHAFRAYFRSKHIDLTPHTLQLFAQGTQAGGLQSLVQTLYLTGIASDSGESARAVQDDTPEERIRRKQEVNLLRQAFNGLAKHSENLLSLTLRVVVLRHNQKRILPVDTTGGAKSMSVWRCTARTFDVALRALAMSKLRLKSLNVFNEAELQQCSLSCEQLDAIDWNDPGLSESLATLKSLSISICTRIPGFRKDSNKDENEDDDEDEDELYNERGRVSRRQTAEKQTETDDENNFVGLARFLPLCMQLNDFELHYLAVRRPRSGPIDRSGSEKILQHLTKQEELPSLERCRLRGLTAKEVDLLDFIKRTTVRELYLETIHLHTGTFGSIIDYCTSNAASLTKVYFRSLFNDIKETGMIHFSGGERSTIGLYRDSELLERDDSSIRDPVTYHSLPPLFMGSPLTMQWMKFQRIEYGSCV